MAWQNGGPGLQEIVVVPLVDGSFEANLPGYEDCRCIPVKNIAGIKITVHCPITGAEMHITPQYITILESKMKKVEDPEMPPSKELTNAPNESQPTGTEDPSTQIGA